ncbi:hypothetical protein WG66_009710 [Moniliophthora roreri]|nr:hypothetical protein WG66_009710 [Moniliophthora roreri]
MSDKGSDKKSLRSRMGTVMRRTSSIVTLGAVGNRPTTPQQQPEPAFPRRGSVASTSDVSSSGSAAGSARPSIDMNAAAAASSSAAGSHVPSPIAESPAREAAASEDDGTTKRQGTLGVSPLAQAVITSEEVEATGANTPQPQPEPATETAPIYQEPPKIFEEATGPGAFVDEPEEMSQRSLRQSHSIDSLKRPQEAPPALAIPEAGPDTAPPAQAKEVEQPPEAAPEAPAPAPERPVHHSPELKTAVDDPGYFTITAPEQTHSPEQFEPDSASLQEAIVRNTIGGGVDAAVETPMVSPRPHGPADTENANMFYISPNPAIAPAPAPFAQEEKAEPAVMPEPAAMPEPVRLESDVTVRATPPSVPQLVVQPAPAPVPAPAPAPHVEVPKSNPIPIPSYNVAEPQAVWAVSVSGSDGKKHVLDEEYRGAGNGPNGSARYEDPFADPAPSNPAPPAVTAHPIQVTMPAPRSAREEVHGYITQREHEDEREHEREHAPPPPVIIVPLPEFNEVIPGRSIREVPSEDTLDQGPGGGHIRFNAQADTDESRPLINRPRSPPPPHSPVNPLSHHHHHNRKPQRGGGGYLNIDTGMHAPRLNISPMASMNGNQPPSASGGPLLHQKGWIEYGLPDGLRYYVHPTLRVTTDIDLRNVVKLEAITKFLELRRGDISGFEGAPAGWELWLREGPVDKKKKKTKGRGRGKDKAEDEFIPLKFWVDHKRRTVTADPLWDTESGSTSAAKEPEDGLDMEYRYWSFVEDHPAHSALPLNARTEAMDVLTWSWSDRLLPPHGAASTPFSQEECNELSNMLRSFSELQNDSPINTIVHTRIVAPQWRQAVFRPSKPLPEDVAKTHRPPLLPFNRPLPLRKRVLDFVVSCVCLGIPYLFLNRLQHHRLDEESGMLRGAGPMMVIGASTCLVAAIVLSASVTFLSLPGLDAIARIAGLVAILLSTFSMASTVVAIFKYKSDLERSTWLSSAAGGIVNYGSVGMGMGEVVGGGGRHSYMVGGGEGMMVHSRRILILSLPLTLLIYSIIAFITGIVLYSFFGTESSPTTRPPGAVLQHHFEGYTRWSVVGVLGGLAGVLFTAVLMLRR